jgi:hypothetical protein
LEDIAMVEVRYQRTVWENGKLELSPLGWQDLNQDVSAYRFRLRPCDLLELPELIYPADKPMPLVIRSLKKILSIYFRERIKIILE